MADNQNDQDNDDVDEKGDRGGSTGNTKKPKDGEKGDQRRDPEAMGTSSVGPTRPGGSGNSRSGSDSND